jgi:hypothetical protein
LCRAEVGDEGARLAADQHCQAMRRLVALDLQRRNLR